MEKRLDGRVAFVTGSSRGIGAAIARRLASDGAKLILHARGDAARANVVAEEIRSKGGTADVVTGNLIEGETAARVVQDAFAIHGALDILVCNAGGGESGLAVDKSVEAIDRILSLNLRAVILSTIEFARLTTSPHGRVVLISSGSATHPAYGATIYAAAKAGAEAFMRSVAQELGERGITLNTVAPGTTRTEMIAGHSWPEKIPKWAALKRIGEPEDIADIVAFLASDDARWLTGVTMAANGGLITTAANILAHDK
jgi:3-oxoacyl-[acyl-carrier protein] reductase